MTIKLWQMQVEAWQPENNLKKAMEMIENTSEGWILVLPEMMIPWYMIWDRWLRDEYIEDCRSINEDIIQASGRKKITIVWWNIDFDETKKNEDGSIRKYNAAFMAANGKILWKRYKTLLPNYRMFDDKRYFTSLKQLAEEEWIDISEYYKPIETVIDGVKTKVSILICEDIWNINKDYAIDPLELTKQHNPDIIAVPSASPFWLNKSDMRRRVLENASKWTKIAYVNPIGTQNNGKNTFVFEWWSALYNDGELVEKIEDFSEDKIKTQEKEKEEIEQIFESTIYYIKEFLQNIGLKKVVIWLSWWVDSALSAALCSIALWKENVVAVNMPTRFNSKTTKNLAKDCAERLWIQYETISIEENVDLRIKQLYEYSNREVSSFNKENIQARERGKLLADMAWHEKAGFTNNGNKDETALWYATLYGDVAGALSILADLSKTQVYNLVKYINEKYWEIIPQWIIDIVPSAELSDKQDVEAWEWDPFDYEFVGKINQAFVEKKKEPADILEMYKKGILKSFLWLPKDILDYYENSLEFIKDLEKLWKLMNINYFKRVQSPPIATISKSSFWFDFREAQNWLYYTRKYRKLKQEILNIN